VELLRTAPPTGQNAVAPQIEWVSYEGKKREKARKTKENREGFRDFLTLKIILSVLCYNVLILSRLD